VVEAAASPGTCSEADVQAAIVVFGYRSKADLASVACEVSSYLNNGYGFGVAPIESYETSISLGA